MLSFLFVPPPGGIPERQPAEICRLIFFKAYRAWISWSLNKLIPLSSSTVFPFIVKVSSLERITLGRGVSHNRFSSLSPSERKTRFIHCCVRHCCVRRCLLEIVFVIRWTAWNKSSFTSTWAPSTDTILDRSLLCTQFWCSFDFDALILVMSLSNILRARSPSFQWYTHLYTQHVHNSIQRFVTSEVYIVCIVLYTEQME